MPAGQRGRLGGASREVQEPHLFHPHPAGNPPGRRRRHLPEGVPAPARGAGAAAASRGPPDVADPGDLPRVSALAPAGAALCRAGARGGGDDARPRRPARPGGDARPDQGGADAAGGRARAVRALPAAHPHALLRGPGASLSGGCREPRARGRLDRVHPWPVPDPLAPATGEDGLPMSRASKPSRGEERRYAEMARLKDKRSRREFLSRHPGLLRREVVARLSEIVPQKVRVDVKEALALAEAAELIARRLRSPEALAQSLRAKGNALYALNENKVAVEHHEQAARLFEKVGKPKEVGRTLSTSIQPLILLGEYERAQTAAARAREIFTGEGDELRLARLELNVGNIYHRQDRFAEALRCYEQSYKS